MPLILPRGETFRISRLQKLASEQAAYLAGLAPNKKLSIRRLMICFGLSRSGDLLSNFQLPASGVGSQTGEEFPVSSFRRAFAPGHSEVGGNFQFPASGFQLWPGGCKAERISRSRSPPGSSRHRKARDGGISGFQLPAPLRREELGKSKCISLRRVKFRRRTRGGEIPE